MVSSMVVGSDLAMAEWKDCSYGLLTTTVKGEGSLLGFNDGISEETLLGCMHGVADGKSLGINKGASLGLCEGEYDGISPGCIDGNN